MVNRHGPRPGITRQFFRLTTRGEGKYEYQNEQQYLKLETNHLSLAEIETAVAKLTPATLYGINVEARDKGNRLLSYTGPFHPSSFGWCGRRMVGK